MAGCSDSFLVDGVAFQKDFLLCRLRDAEEGVQATPRSWLLNIELELKSEKENAEVRWRCCQSCCW